MGLVEGAAIVSPATKIAVLQGRNHLPITAIKLSRNPCFQGISCNQKFSPTNFKACRFRRFFRRCTNCVLDGIVQKVNTPTSSSPRNKARDQPVFDAVAELLATHGMQLSMDTVAAHVGCSKQTLYSRYGSKADLLRLVMQQHVATTTARLVSGDSRPLRQVLLEFAIHYLEHRNLPRVRQAAQLFAAGANQFHDEARTLYNLSGGAVRSQVAEWLRTEMARGRLIHDDPQFMAELLISMLSGQDFERQRFHVPHRDTLEKRRRWAEFAIDAFLRAFPAPPTGIPGSVNKTRPSGVFPR